MLETALPETRQAERNGLSCPSCEKPEARIFLELGHVPTNSMVLLDTKEQAVGYPKGKLTLAFCESCGFIFNPDFDPGLVDYSQSYESSQAFSPRFNEFAAKLSSDLAREYDLAGKKVVEIGCGGGDFLQQVELHGIKIGVGVDPAADPDHRVENATQNLSFIREFFAKEHGELNPDFLCCRHTLEHVPDPANFVRIVRESLGEDSNVPVFFEVPDTLRVLKEAAFWDVYYEHCSYFTPESLAALFEQEGFTDVRTELDFDDQYLLLHCMPTQTGAKETGSREYVRQLAEEVEAFSEKYRNHIAGWSDFLAEANAAGKRVVVWGGGSKGVAFVNSVPGGDQIDFIVDINPAKQEKFAAGTGHRIVGPDELRTAVPDVVLVMNPIYTEEITETLRGMGIEAEVRSV